jgi:hypothetical protein
VLVSAIANNCKLTGILCSCLSTLQMYREGSIGRSSWPPKWRLASWARLWLTRQDLITIFSSRSRLHAFSRIRLVECTSCKTLTVLRAARHSESARDFACNAVQSAIYHPAQTSLRAPRRRSVTHRLTMTNQAVAPIAARSRALGQQGSIVERVGTAWSPCPRPPGSTIASKRLKAQLQLVTDNGLEHLETNRSAPSRGAPAERQTWPRSCLSWAHWRALAIGSREGPPRLPRRATSRLSPMTRRRTPMKSMDRCLKRRRNQSPRPLLHPKHRRLRRTRQPLPGQHSRPRPGEPPRPPRDRWGMPRLREANWPRNPRRAFPGAMTGHFRAPLTSCGERNLRRNPRKARRQVRWK